MSRHTRSASFFLCNCFFVFLFFFGSALHTYLLTLVSPCIRYTAVDPDVDSDVDPTTGFPVELNERFRVLYPPKLKKGLKPPAKRHQNDLIVLKAAVFTSNISRYLISFVQSYCLEHRYGVSKCSGG